MRSACPACRAVSSSRCITIHLKVTGEPPASVTVITSEEIKLFGYRTLADILESMPGMYVTYDRN